MKRLPSIDELRVSAVSAFVTVLLFMSGLLVLFTPLPMIYAYRVRGRRSAIVSAIVAGAVVAALYAILMPSLAGKQEGFVMAFFALPGVGLTDKFPIDSARYFGGTYFLFFTSIAVAIGEGFRRNVGVTRQAAVAVFAGVLCAAISFGIASVISESSVIVGIREYIESIVAEVVKLNQSANVSNSQMAYLETHGSEVAGTVVSLGPSIVFITALITTVINVLVGKRFAKSPRAVSQAREVIGFRVPDYCVWILISCGVVFFADSYFFHANWPSIIAINGLVAMGAVYFFQGFAVASYFLERLRMRFLKLVGYAAIILFFQTVGVILVGLGLADVWLHFRERAHASAAKHQE